MSEIERPAVASELAPPSARDLATAAREKPPLALTRTRGAGIGWLALLVSVLALGAIGYQWWQQKQSGENLRLELAQRLASADKAAAQARQLAEDARQAQNILQTRLAGLEAKLAESQTQQVALESLYQTLLRNQGDWSLAEVEQIVNIAAQQLQLAGNVKAAIVALEAGDARLARMNDPQLAGLRMVLQQDLERLKAVPLVDTQGISLRLERISADVDALPLAYLARPAVRPEAAKAAVAQASRWQRTWQEFKDLVRIEHVEQPAPVLLSPEQSYFLRENLKLRLQGARFAVASRDNNAFRTDLQAAKTWLQRYFDQSAPSAQSALQAIEKMLASSLEISVPDIQSTLTAIHDLRIAREKGTAQ